MLLFSVILINEVWIKSSIWLNPIKLWVDEIAPSFFLSFDRR